MTIDEAEKEIHRLRMTMVKKAAASACKKRAIGPATRRVIDVFSDTVQGTDEGFDVLLKASQFSPRFEKWGSLTANEIRAFIREQEGDVEAIS